MRRRTERVPAGRSDEVTDWLAELARDDDPEPGYPPRRPPEDPPEPPASWRAESPDAGAPRTVPAGWTGRQPRPGRAYAGRDPAQGGGRNLPVVLFWAALLAGLQLWWLNTPA